MSKKVHCVFCNTKKKRAKEHVYPQWLLRELGLFDTQVRGSHRTALGTMISNRDQNFGSILLGNVCEGCNNGWMRELEDRAMPILKGIVGVNPTISRLTEFESKILATWAFKTLIIHNLSSNYRNIVPKSHFRFLHNTKSIPPRVTVDLALFENSSPISWLQSQQFVYSGSISSYTNKVYNLSLRIRSLGLKVFWSPLGEAEESEMSQGRLSPWQRNIELNFKNLNADLFDYEFVSVKSKKV